MLSALLFIGGALFFTKFYEQMFENSVKILVKR